MTSAAAAQTETVSPCSAVTASDSARPEESAGGQAADGGEVTKLKNQIKDLVTQRAKCFVQWKSLTNKLDDEKSKVEQLQESVARREKCCGAGGDPSRIPDPDVVRQLEQELEGLWAKIDSDLRRLRENTEVPGNQ